MADFQTTVQPEVPAFDTTVTPEPSAPLLDTSQTATAPVLDQQTVEGRARNYHFALGQMSPGIDSLRFRLSQQGGEDGVRREYSYRSAAELQERRQGMLREYMRNRQPGQYDQAEMQGIMQLASGELDRAAADPRTFLEQRFARRLTEVQQESPAQREVPTEGQVALREVTQGIERSNANREYAQRRLEEVQADFRAQGGLETGAQIVRSFVPFVNWYDNQNALKGPGVGGFLPGDNLRSQVEAYYSLPPQEAAAALDRAIDTFKRGDGRDNKAALHFLTTLAHPDSSDFAYANLFGILDIASLVPAGTVARLARGARRGEEAATTGARAAETAAEPTPEVQRAAVAQAQVSDAAARHPGEVAPVQEAAGDYWAAANTRAVQQLLDKADAAGAVDSFESIRTHVRSLFDIEGLMRGSTLVQSNELAQRLVRNREMLLDSAINNTVNINRLSPGGMGERVAADEAAVLLRSQYPHASDAIANVTLARTLEDQIGNIAAAKIPKRMRDTAQKHLAAEDALNAAEAMPRYQAYRAIQDEFNGVVERLQQLSNIAPIKAKRTGDFAPKAAMQRAELAEVPELATRGNELAAKLRELKVTPAERKLFDRYDTTLTSYRTAAKKYGVDPRPPGRGIDPLNPAHVSPAAHHNIVTGLGNTRYLETQFVRRDGQLFTSHDAAYRAASEDYKLSSFWVRQQGSGYYIAVHTPLNETSQTVRLASAMDVKGAPQSFANSFLYFFRKADNKIPQELSDAMKIATYGGSFLTNTVAKFMKETIGPAIWTAAERKQFSSFIERQRVQQNPLTGDKGRYSASQFEFENEWRQQFGQMPDLKQSTAYWSYVQLHDLDYTILNLGIYRDKVRQGIQLFDFPTAERMSAAPGIEGRLLKEMPERHADFNAGVLIHDANPDAMKNNFFMLGTAGDKVNSAKADARIQELMNKGYRLVQISHLAADELKKVPGFAKAIPEDRPLNFILTPNHTVAPLGYKQLPYKPGIREYEAPYFIRQPNVKGGTYYGDSSLHPFWSEKEAKMWVERYNHSRDLLARIERGAVHLEPELKTYLDKNMPYTLDEFKSLYRSKDEGGQGLSLAERFHVTESHTRTADIPGAVKFMRDVKDNPYSLYHEVNLRYALERGDGLLSIANKGTKENPVWNLQQAPVIDALPTLNRAAHHLLNQRYLGDLQHKAAEGFLAQFGKIIDGAPQELGRDPVWTLFHAPLKETSDKAFLRAAENYRTVAKEFFKIRSSVETHWHTFVQKMDDMLRSPEKRMAVPEPWLLGTMRNFTGVLRGFTHHYQLMSPTQLFQQASGATVIIAAEGMRGLAAIPMGMYSRAMLVSNRSREMLEEAAQLLSRRQGVKADHFIESYDAMVRTGYHNVGKEYATHGDWRAPTVIPTGAQAVGGAVLDIGMKPFKWGEEFVRHTSWHASYMRWRNANPSAKLDDNAIREVLAYADRLSGNMSAASTASWQHKGMLSLPTTFWSYQARVMEQMLEMAPGSFTPAQKLRILVGQGLFWGVPAGLSIPLGLPLVKMTQEYLAKTNTPVNNDQGVLMNIAVNGFLSAGLEAATGTQLNITERYGPGSSRLLTDMASDKAFFELFLGAAGGVIFNNLKAASPFLHAAIDGFRREPTGIKLTPHDAAQILEAQPGLSQAMRAYYAFSLGQYFDKAGLNVADMTKFQALMFGLTGLQPTHISQMYSILNNERTVREAQNREMRNVQYWFNQALKATEEGRSTDADAAFKRMHAHVVLGGFREDQKLMVWQRAVRGNEDTLERVLRRNAMNSPEGLRFLQDYQNRNKR